jgi:hypothetical protein
VFSANAGLRGDRAAALERAREAIKGNPTALERLETDINANLEGALGSGLYSNRATQIYDKIAGALADGKKVSMGTREWKTDGGATGPSGEDLDTVPGLAGAHAYAVVGVSHPERPLEGATRLTVKVRNPWGAGPGGLGRGYTTERGSGRMVGQAVPNAAESDLDLTDFMSYCQTIAIV